MSGDEGAALDLWLGSDLLPVRSMTRTRRCGPLLKREHKNAATLAISTENRKQGGLVQVHPPIQTQATACSIYCRRDRWHAHGTAARCSRKGKGAGPLAISRENRKHGGGLMQVQPPLQAQATACAIYCRCDR